MGERCAPRTVNGEGTRHDPTTVLKLGGRNNATPEKIDAKESAPCEGRVFRRRLINRTAREWFGSTTPDGDRLDDVHWLEVTEHLDDDFSEIRREILA